MAEEKSKKSFVLAYDSDDDEYASEKDSEQTELSLILDKLSLGSKKEKKLLILSPNGLLLHRVHMQNLRRKPENRSPDATCGPNLVYKRPFAGEFMKFCLERFEVGIWSSANELDQKHSTNSGFKTLENSDKPMFFKDLSKVFQKFKEFSASNTILIDPEPYKALINPENTGVFPVTYVPTNKNDDFLDPEGKFCSYLDDLANASDVQAYIKENTFGQPKIDSSHLDWSFYRKVSKIVSGLA
ncbi:uncharacterized protein LOC108850972 [Raphanus sativus]|uniref:Mitochondrial import inner membrane translocase subunit TIM50 n=1 Tax=Raphanus sativus TaxID=3726 RepID=A0A6J0N5Z7_RAPSA|nr:uncharacterized protein LOC108850972 [Raphanus sativus]